MHFINGLKDQKWNSLNKDNINVDKLAADLNYVAIIPLLTHSIRMLVQYIQPRIRVTVL